MSETPERIWACMDGPMVGLFVSGGYNAGWPEYIRADLFDAVKAERAALEARVKVLASPSEDDLDRAVGAMTDAMFRNGIGEKMWRNWSQPAKADAIAYFKIAVAALQENTDDR